MRHLAWSRIDVEGGTRINKALPLPQPSDEPWRDYKDITVLAFPTPLDDTGQPLKPQSVKSNRELPWEKCLLGSAGGKLNLPPVSGNDLHWVEVTFPDAVMLRTIEFSSIRAFNHPWHFEPGVTVTVQAVLPDGKTQEILNMEMPSNNWQDNSPASFACSEVPGVTTYRISIANKHNMALASLRLFSAARKNNWESEAGWTLRSIERSGASPKQSPAAFINLAQIRDITAEMDRQGNLNWEAPSGKWTILRIGHINTGERNAPAPTGGEGWECDKLSESGPDVHFANYIGRLSGKGGSLANGLLDGMHIDSWECRTQTWTPRMEAEFGRVSGYPLRKWLPAMFGYVVNDQETTTRFLRDWRATISDLFTNKFYGRMAKLAKENGLSVSFETAASHVFPADIFEFWKYADVPMCEFWQPLSDVGLGSINYQPTKPTASAARLYGKPRVAAEAFPSNKLTWNEHWDVLKEAANVNSVEGVTHLVFHTYTHNPRPDLLQPGSSLGQFGTPFLRGQTWWKHMPEFVAYFSRCSYLLERGKPVSDVLWYVGDEINHRPDQNAPFPDGFKADYCNPDVLLNRLTVRDGKLFTPEGISYRVLWLPEAPRMLPETLEKLRALVSDGATIIGEAPHGLATLSGGKEAQKRFDTAVRAIWGKTPQPGIRKAGKGTVVSGMTLATALNKLNITPDVTGGALWLHRKVDGADWYFVSAPKGSGFRGALDFRNTGNVELWDPVTGTSVSMESRTANNRTSVSLDLPQAGACFVVFRQTGSSDAILGRRESNEAASAIPLTEPWTLAFPSGWDAPATLQIAALKAWKDLDLSPEAKAFSGTATYTTTFDIGEVKPETGFSLDLGRVDMIAVVSLNGKPLRTLWAPPYSLDITSAVQPGVNTLTVEVTGTWYNRLVYDAGQPEDKRKTWVINGPKADAGLKDSGLLGPVILYIAHK
jgi:hypothetical protein